MSDPTELSPPFPTSPTEATQGAPTVSDEVCDASKAQSCAGPEVWIQSPAERWDAALDAVPRFLGFVSLLLSKTRDLSPSAALTAVLHWTTTALGTSHRLSRSSGSFCAPFSLVMVHPECPRGSWLEQLGSPWLDTVRLRMHLHQQVGPAQLSRELQNWRQQPSIEGVPVNVAKEARKVQLALAPCGFVRFPLAGRLREAVEHSHDGSVLSLGEGLDPVQELLTHGPKQTLELSKLLALSWAGHELPALKGVVPKGGTVHLLWQTDPDQARQLLWGSRSFWRQAPPPVLFQSHLPVPGHLPALDEAPQQPWSLFLQRLSSQPLRPPESRIWSLSPEAETVVAEFGRSLLADAGKFAPLNARHFDWIPDLAIRLALTLAVIENLDNAASTSSPVIGAPIMRRACVLAAWLAGEHRDCLVGLRQASAVNAEADNDLRDDIDIIDREQLQNDILRKLGAKGPLSRRDLARSFDKLSARHRDTLLQQLKKMGLVTENAEGLLQLAPQRELVASKY